MESTRSATGVPVAGHGWSRAELGGLVTTGVLVTVLWLIFRRLKFPGE